MQILEEYLGEYQELFCQDKQLVVLIFQSGAIKPLQKKRMQQDNVIKRTLVKLQTMENNITYQFPADI